MSIIRPFAEQGNYTEMHNVLFDRIMPDVSPNAWKVLCLIVRKTKGWHKKTDMLSYSQLQEGTGIVSPSTIRAAVKELLEKKYIIATTGETKWEPTTYSLNLALEIVVEDKASTTKTVVDKQPPTTKTVVDATTISVVAPTTISVDTKERLNKGKESARPISFFEERISGLIVTFGELKVGAARRIADNKQKGDNLTFITRCLENLTEKEIEDYRKFLAQTQAKQRDPEKERRAAEILENRKMRG